MIFDVLSVSAILFSGVTAVFSVLAYAKVVGMEKSTHQIQYMPAPMPDLSDSGNPTGKDLAKQFMPDDYDEEF